jgi:hypothetical protein
MKPRQLVCQSASPTITSMLRCKNVHLRSSVEDPRGPLLFYQVYLGCSNKNASRCYQQTMGTQERLMQSQGRLKMRKTVLERKQIPCMHVTESYAALVAEDQTVCSMLCRSLF